MCCSILFNQTSRDMTMLFGPLKNDPFAKPLVIKVASEAGKAADQATKHPTYRQPKIIDEGIISGT